MLCIVCENHEENAGNSEFKRRKNLLSGSEFPWSQQQVLTYGNEEKGVVKDRILDKPSICPNYTGKLSILKTTSTRTKSINKTTGYR